MITSGHQQFPLCLHAAERREINVLTTRILFSYQKEQIHSSATKTCLKLSLNCSGISRRIFYVTCIDDRIKDRENRDFAKDLLMLSSWAGLIIHLPLGI